MNDREKEDCYKFYKDNFNIDLNQISKEEAKTKIEIIDQVLNSEIEKEEQKNQNLINNYNNEIDKLKSLEEQLYDAYMSE